MPRDWIKIYSPPPSESLTTLRLGFALRMAVSVSGIIRFHPCWYRDVREKRDTNKNTNKSSGCPRLWQNTREQIRSIGLFLQRFRTPANICEHDVVPRGGLSQTCNINCLSCPTLLECPIVSHSLFLKLSHRSSPLIVSPLLPRKRTFAGHKPLSAKCQKQTCAVQNAMSALPPIADMCGATRDVCFVPIADISHTCHSATREQAMADFKARWCATKIRSEANATLWRPTCRHSAL